MPFKKGQPRPKGAGRKLGQQNRITTSMKEAWLEAFNGMGGVPALVKWGQENQTPFYQSVTRLIPHEVVGRNGGPLQFKWAST